MKKLGLFAHLLGTLVVALVLCKEAPCEEVDEVVSKLHRICDARIAYNREVVAFLRNPRITTHEKLSTACREIVGTSRTPPKVIEPIALLELFREQVKACNGEAEKYEDIKKLIIGRPDYLYLHLKLQIACDKYSRLDAIGVMCSAFAAAADPDWIGRRPKIDYISEDFWEGSSYAELQELLRPLVSKVACTRAEYYIFDYPINPQGMRTVKVELDYQKAGRLVQSLRKSIQYLRQRIPKVHKLLGEKKGRELESIIDHNSGLLDELTPLKIIPDTRYQGEGRVDQITPLLEIENALEEPREVVDSIEVSIREKEGEQGKKKRVLN